MEVGKILCGEGMGGSCKNVLFCCFFNGNSLALSSGVGGLG